MNIILFVSFIYFAYKRLRLLLHFFQQEEYDNYRFLKLMCRHFRLIDKKLSSLLLFIGIISLFVGHPIGLKLILTILFVVFAFFTKNPIKTGKKPLVVTRRVMRIFTLSGIFTVALSLVFFYAAQAYFIIFVIALIVLVQLLPFLMLLANGCLAPIEKIIQKRFLREAQQKLKQLEPVVIGITGSYGKTSVKHILAHILSSAASTLATPGSVNTLMGVSRIIREKLQPSHKFFIVEMGAYGPGSIKKLCQLVEPKFGVLTAVGDAHYERFKTLETVAKAKFELSDAVAKNTHGFMVINQDAVAEKFIQQYALNFQDKMICITSDHSVKEGNAVIKNIRQTAEGLVFDIELQKEIYTIQVPLYGLHQANNIALCFVLAKKIGVPVNTIISSLKTMPQIEHRLQVIKNKMGSVVIDDAYNANPIGFQSALDVLKLLKPEEGRAILVTPGMVELGKLHDEKHFELGQAAANVADIVLVITPQRITQFVDGFKQSAADTQQLLTFNSFKEAKAWLDSNAKPSDIILYENDLPDLYEEKVTL